MGKKFECQKEFPDMVYIKNLRLDFYFWYVVKRKKIYKCAIEFDGVQHFKPIEHWGGIDGLRIRKIRDTIKDEFCIKNNIYLLRIDYTCIKTIGSIIDNFLGKHHYEKQ